MNKIIIRPPPPQQKREHIFSVRLTSSEHRQLQQLAQQMDVSLSHLVRHFLKQAVDYYREETQILAEGH